MLATRLRCQNTPLAELLRRYLGRAIAVRRPHRKRSFACMQGSPEREKERTDAFFLPVEIKKTAVLQRLCNGGPDKDSDIWHFVNEKVQILPGIHDTRTIITFKAFGVG
jgi:hypothetical protein